MARRPIRKKQAARLRKALLRRPIKPVYRDLFKWLKDWGYANTTGEAMAITRAGRVKFESHVLGLHRGIKVQQPDGSVKEQDVVDPAVPAEYLRDHTLVVVEPAK